MFYSLINSYIKFKDVIIVTKVTLQLTERRSFAALKITTTILSFFLASTILFNSLRVSVTYAYYYLDMADFIERLCENKDTPELQCNGKCHLKKVVENNHSNDKAPFKELNIKEVTLYVLGQLNYDFVLISKQEERLMDYNNLYAYTFANSTDHPPQV